MKILILDDEFEITESMKEIMEMMDKSLTIVQKNNGEEALDYLNNNKDIDLLITDLNLSPKDIKGIDLIKKVASNQIVNKMIVLTGDTGMFDDKGVQKDNIELYVQQKPIMNMESFMSLVKS